MYSSNQIKSFVFLDLETTGLPYLENNQTKLTELSMVAVQSSHLRSGVVPRVQNKLTLCFNPRKLMSYEAEKITGLSNILLEALPPFSNEAVHQINSFLRHIPQPICFVAHNGDRFDYPILQTHISKTTVPLLDVFCVDSLTAFRELLQEEQESARNIPMSITKSEFLPVSCNDPKLSASIKPEAVDIASGSGLCSAGNFQFLQSNLSSNVEVRTKDMTPTNHKDVPWECTKEFDELLCNLPEIIGGDYKMDISQVQKNNERTPEKQKIKTSSLTIEHFQPNKRVKVEHGRRNLNFEKGFKMHEVYRRLTKMEPSESHKAEADVNMLITCAATLGNTFVDWANNNVKKFCDVPIMSALKKLGPKYSLQNKGSVQCCKCYDKFKMVNGHEILVNL